MKRLFFCLLLLGVGCEGESPDPPRPNIDKERVICEYERGVGCSQRQDWATAVVHYSEAIKFDSTNKLFYINRGEAYGKLGKYPKAITDFDIALGLLVPRHDLSPAGSPVGLPASRLNAETIGKVHYYRGLAYQKLAQRAEAEEDVSLATSFGYEPDED